VNSEEGEVYAPRIIGEEDDVGRWQGWIELVPTEGGTLLVTGRETTQPKRSDLEYWATGLSPIYVEGALARAQPAR
jgi:hypothetical protein